MRGRSTAIFSVLLLGAAVVMIALEEWQGPIVLSLSEGHGIHAADLLAVPLAALAIGIWRGHAAKPDERRRWGGRIGPVSIIVLGVLLLLAALDIRAGGGSMVPSGGGTFAGTIAEAAGTRALPVNRWSDVAATYDGAIVRMFVNGREVAGRHVKGSIQVTGDPLWIGGNRPYGEFFHGVIDEVRVYARALSADEVRADMTKPVSPADGLAAAYSFDAGSGTTVADVSGNGNDGVIRGAAWTQGRRGHALSFDGAGAVVRVPPSVSLNLTRGMTLSGWVRPTARQSGWRTIVQHQVDAYLLTAGSDRQARLGRFDDLRAAAVVAAIAWLCIVIATGRGGWVADRRRSWWQPVALFVVGSLADALIAPSGSLVAPMLVALWLAGTAQSRAEAVAFLLCAGACMGLTIASIADVGGLGTTMSRDDGGTARAVALGAVLVLAGAVQVGAGRAARRKVGPSPDVH